jgi:hypothetical protein
VRSQRLLKAVEAVLAMTARWDAEADDLDARAITYSENGQHHQSAAASDMAQARNVLASHVEAAIECALTGEDGSDAT